MALWVLRIWSILLICNFFSSIRSEEEAFQCRSLYQYNGTSGDVYSPFYERGYYDPSLWCEFRITAPVGYRVKLHFEDIDLYPSDFCIGGYIRVEQVTGEKDEDRDTMLKLCGKDEPYPIITDPGVNIVQILLVTEAFGSGKGFHIRYEAAPDLELCGKGKVECQNRNCYDPSTQKCNGIDDCGDGTDEEKCNLPLATVECGKPPIEPDTIYRDQDRIVGGQEVIPHSFPWQISMQNRYLPISHSCGGTLINAQWVVTAAHCFMGNAVTANWRIHIGKHHKYSRDKTEQVRYVEKIMIFPNTTEDTTKPKFDVNNDIGLMKLSAPVQFTDAVRPACLPEAGYDIEAGTKCYSTGWGQTRGTGYSDVLKQTQMTIQSRWECGFREWIEICVKNTEQKTSPCAGDSGGPLNCKIGDKWHVMGATSYGTWTNGQQIMCSLDETVYMRMSAKIDWIKSMMDRFG